MNTDYQSKIKQTTQEHSAWSRSQYLNLALWFFPAAIVTWGLHESAHWAAGRLLGYDMRMTFNEAGPVEGTYQSALHGIIVALAGPLVTWIQAAIAWQYIMKKGQIQFYAFVFLAFWMRVVAMGLSFTSKPNDEAAASLLMGLPMWVIPTISVAFLFALTYSASKTIRAGWKGNALAYVMASLVMIMVVTLNGLVF